MKTWNDVKASITSISETDKDSIDLTSHVIARLVEKRNKLGISQRDLAEMTGILQPAIARMESGGTIQKIPTLNTVAKALGFKLNINLTDEAEVNVITGNGNFPGIRETMESVRNSYNLK